MTIAGHLVWTKGLKGFVCEKRPAGYQPRTEEPPVVASYPLSADLYAMSLLKLEQRFAPPPETHEPKVKLESAGS